MDGMNLFAERVLCSVWQVSLTTALVSLPLLALRGLLRKRYPARVLCLVWTVLLVRLLIPVQLSLPEAPVQVAPRLTRVSRASGPVPGGQAAFDGIPMETEWVETAQSARDGRQSGSVSVETLLFVGWAVPALLLFTGQMIAGWRYGRRLRRTASVVSAPALLEACRAEERRLGFRRALPLLCVRGADGPMLAGLLRPVLIFPEEGISEAVLPMVLRHELTHYQRRDLWRKLAALAARCVHWFNPAVYLLVRALYEDIELACDSCAVEGLDIAARKFYGRTILDYAARQCTARQVLTTRFAGGKETLQARLAALFETGAKKRGVALLLLCVLTVGTVGGVVAVGNAETEPLGAAPATEVEPSEQALAGKVLTEEAAVLLADKWGAANMGRSLEPVMPYLTVELQRNVFRHMTDPEAGEGVSFDFEPTDEHYGVPEENRRRFWFIGVSSPYISAYTVVPDLEHQAAYVVYNWTAEGMPDTREYDYVHFAWEKGAWKLLGIDGSPYADGREVSNGVSSEEDFLRLYANDLGLPKGMPYVWYAREHWKEDPGLEHVYDPVEAAVLLLELEGGTATLDDEDVTTLKYERDIKNGTGWTHGMYATHLGKMVHYRFADGSVIDIVMADLGGDGFVPVDWSINGKNSRSISDLTNQWAYGVQTEEAHFMFPLLAEQGAGYQRLIEEQERMMVSAGEPTEERWFWKYYRYHGSIYDYRIRYFPDGAEIIYSESGTRFMTNIYIQRLYFTTEDGVLKIGDWEEVHKTDETAYQWYTTYYEPYFEIFPKNSRDYNIDSINWELELIARGMTGTANDNGLDTVVEQITDLDKNEGWRYLVTLRFADGSGWIAAEIHRVINKGPSEYGWHLESLSVSEQKPAVS